MDVLIGERIYGVLNEICRQIYIDCLITHHIWYSSKLSARLAQSVEHETLNLRVVGSSPTLGVIFSTIFKRNQSYFFGISRFKSRKSPPLCLYYGRILAYVGPYILVRMSRKCGAVA